MWHRIILVAMGLLFFNSGNAQRMVQSRSYNVMLKTLLSHTVPEVSAADANKKNNVVYLDAREEGEYNVSHIKDAIWIGYDDFNMERVQEIDKDKKIIVYCSVGKRSENISEKLLAAGYKDVANMYGGIFEWVNADLPVYNRSGKTKKVHAYNKTWGVWLNKGEKVYE